MTGAVVYELTPDADAKRSGLQSKVGGLPDPVGNSPWPACAQCRQPMAFLFQLVDGEGGLALPGARAVHVFQCENPDGACPVEAPDGGANAAIVFGGAVPAGTRATYPERAIRFVPRGEDAPELTIDQNTGSSAQLAAYDKALAQAAHSKAGGVPLWAQGPAWPEQDGQRLRFLAQLDAETWGLHFGDDGVGFLFAAPEPSAKPFRFVRQSY